jgi:hypothetical protein
MCGFHRWIPELEFDYKFLYMLPYWPVMACALNRVLIDEVSRLPFE